MGRGNRDAEVTRPRRALALNPFDVEAWLDLGRALIRAMRPDAAVRALETAAALDPAHPGLGEALAAAFRRDARYREAIAIARRQPPGDQNLYERAVCLAALGEGAKALAAFDAALAHDPEFAAAWLGSHAVALETRGLDDALVRLGRAVACGGANGRYWAYLYAYARLFGRDAEADALFARRLKGHPKRLNLAQSLDAVMPDVAPGAAVFGLSASLLVHALGEARVQGLVLEFGVRRGASLAQLARAAGQTVHGFDSFEGLPEAWGAIRAGALSTAQALPAIAGDVVLHPGWFADTLGPFLAAHQGAVRLVNIDCDVYSSAVEVLGALAPRLRVGSVLIFDEYIGNRTWRDDEFKAFQEFRAAHRVEARVFALNPFTKQVAFRVDAIAG